MRRLAALVAAALAFCFANQPALAGKRLALIIGNSNYQNVMQLTNPANAASGAGRGGRCFAFNGKQVCE